MKSPLFRPLLFTVLLLFLVPARSSVEATLSTNLFIENLIRQGIERKSYLEWSPEGWTFSLFIGNSRYLGLTDFDVKHFMLWVHSNDTFETLAATRVHELGHIFAYQFLTQSLRDKWLEIRGIPKNTPWLSPSTETSYYNFGEEDFAECLSWTFQKGTFKSQLGPIPNQAQQDLIKEWVTTLPGTPAV